jgi:hypothetical protein
MLSEYVHGKAVPMLVHSTFSNYDEGDDEEEELSVRVAAVMSDLDSDEYHFKVETNTCPARPFLCQPQHSLSMDDSIGIQICCTKRVLC